MSEKYRFFKSEFEKRHTRFLGDDRYLLDFKIYFS